MFFCCLELLTHRRVSSLKKKKNLSGAGELVQWAGGHASHVKIQPLQYPAPKWNAGTIKNLKKNSQVLPGMAK